MLKHLCPCCGKHCYLTAPQCERGAAYAATGVIPPRKPRPEGHGGMRDEKKMARKKRYLALEPESKLIFNLCDMGRIISGLSTGGIDKDADVTDRQKELYGEMFSCLEEEDKRDLLMLLEKVDHAWKHAYGDATTRKEQ